MSRVAAVAPVLPDNRYPQSALTDAFAALVLPPGSDRRVLDRLHQAAGVEHRHLALPLERYAELDGFREANDAFIEVAVELGSRALADALTSCGLAGADVDFIVSTSVTGLAAPSIDARLAPRLGLRPDVKRMPSFGLGCVAGAAGMARVHDYLRGHPDEVAVLLAVELCSLTVQRDDPSVANLVASGLFGDGAAALVMVGERRARTLGLQGGPSVVDTRSLLYPGTERVLGWDIVDTGFRIVLDPAVSGMVETQVGPDLDGFLAQHDLKTADVDRWISHPGGPRVLDAVRSAARLPDGALDVSWSSLARVGNLSSASVLHVLADTLAGPPPDPGAWGLLMAMGPGFSAELVLLRW